jgi:methionine-rich copper-binding protein CopC
MSRLAFRRAATLALSVATLLILLLPAAVAAHAELDTSTPADGETVIGSPPVIEATYTETLDPDGSSLVLVDAAGVEIATGGVTETDPTKAMSIADVPDLAPGDYEVKSTTTSADDGDVDRTTWSFTVVAAPSPSPTPTEAPSASAAPSATASPSPSATPVAASPSGASASPSGDTGQPAASTSDVLLPILVVLAIVAIAGVYLYSRRNRTSPPA